MLLFESYTHLQTYFLHIRCFTYRDNPKNVEYTCFYFTLFPLPIEACKPAASETSIPLQIFTPDALPFLLESHSIQTLFIENAPVPHSIRRHQMRVIQPLFHSTLAERTPSTTAGTLFRAQQQDAAAARSAAPKSSPSAEVGLSTYFWPLFCSGSFSFDISCSQFSSAFRRVSRDRYFRWIASNFVLFQIVSWQFETANCQSSRYFNAQEPDEFTSPNFLLLITNASISRPVFCKFCWLLFSMHSNFSS